MHVTFKWIKMKSQFWWAYFCLHPIASMLSICCSFNFRSIDNDQISIIIINKMENYHRKIVGIEFNLICENNAWHSSVSTQERKHHSNSTRFSTKAIGKVEMNIVQIRSNENPEPNVSLNNSIDSIVRGGFSARDFQVINFHGMRFCTRVCGCAWVFEFQTIW